MLNRIVKGRSAPRRLRTVMPLRTPRRVGSVHQGGTQDVEAERSGTHVAIDGTALCRVRRWPVLDSYQRHPVWSAIWFVVILLIASLFTAQYSKGTMFYKAWASHW